QLGVLQFLTPLRPCSGDCVSTTEGAQLRHRFLLTHFAFPSVSTIGGPGRVGTANTHHDPSVRSLSIWSCCIGVSTSAENCAVVAGRKLRVQWFSLPTTS